jgi:predicted nucleotidyltransferase
MYSFSFSQSQIIDELQSKLNLTELVAAQIMSLIDNNCAIFGSFIMSIVCNDAFKINDLDIMVNLDNKNNFKNQLLNFTEGNQKVFTLDNALNTDNTIGVYNKIDIIKDTEQYKILNSDIVLHVSFINKTTTYSNYADLIKCSFYRSNWFKFSKVYYNNNMIMHPLNRDYYKNKNILIEGNINKFVNGYLFITKYQTEKGFVLTPNSQYYSVNKHFANVTSLNKYKKFYKSKGLVVIPLANHDTNREGKAPAVSNWMNKDLTYTFQVDKSNNLGIVCGEKSGIVCIDVDTKDDGVKYFEQLIQKYGLPKCPTQTTPNNGFHYIFKYDPIRMEHMDKKIKGATINGKKIGIDFWIKNCQFVASPSINKVNGNSYKWVVTLDECEPPALPDWIYDLYFNEEIDENCNIIVTDDLSELSDITNELDDDIRVNESFIKRLCKCFRY